MKLLRYIHFLARCEILNKRTTSKVQIHLLPLEIVQRSEQALRECGLQNHSLCAVIL